MYVAKHAGGNQVSTSEPFREGSAVQGQLLSSYIEGFLRREHNGPEDLEELVGTLRKICGNADDGDTSAIREAIEALTQAAELREVNASGHGEQCGHYAGIIASGLNLSSQEVADVAFAARVHDVGKLFINERILNKSGPLTEEEFSVIKTHPQASVEVLRAIPHIERVAQAVLSHHEAFDGSGYPFGLQGEGIPLFGRILSVVDTYVNMMSERPFAPSKTHEQAIAELEKLSGTRFDGMIVRLFARLLKMERSSIMGGGA
jgi:HD-GYP domain-containing protein (c-di-GMP phosphodiesterase class II)